MGSFWALFKVLFISATGLSLRQIQADRIKFLKKLGLGLIVMVAIAPTIWLYTQVLMQGYDVLAPLGQQGAILTLGLVLVSSVVFFFGIFYVISFFYFAADAQNMLALPLTGGQVLGARFSVLLCYEYLTELPFLLPPLLVYGIKSGASLTYWVFALAGLIVTPLLPLSLATLPTVIVMRFANLSRRKDLFKILGGLIVLVLAVGSQFIFQKAGPNAMDPAFLQSLLTDQNGFIKQISRVFPSTLYLSLALIQAGTITGIHNLAIFKGISLLAVALAWLVGDKLYFQGLAGSREASARRSALSKAEYQRQTRGGSALLSYWMKEIRLLLRTPTYFMNSVVTNLLVPVLLAVPFLIQSRNQPGMMPWEQLMTIPGAQTIIVAAISGLIIFLAGSNAITATALSREGKEFYVSKYIPLSYERQIQAKLLSAYIFGLMGAILLIITAQILMPLDFAMVAILAVVGLTSIVPVIEAGLLLDILRPKLTWENEQQAFKQNLNVIFSMIFSVLLGGAILYPTIRFIHTLWLAAGFMFVCFLLTAVILYYILMTWGVKRYRELEG